MAPISVTQTFNNLVTATVRTYDKSLSDLVSNNNALYRKLAKKGNVKLQSGGYEIQRDIEYAENGTYLRAGEYDTLNMSPSEVLTKAIYPWKYVYMHVMSSGPELRANSGKEQMIDLVERKVTNAIHTFANNMSADMYSDGLAPNQINGLQALIADTGTGTVGSINSSADTWWKNKVQSNAAPLQGGGAVTISKTTIQTMWNNLYLELKRNMDEPDFVVCSNDYYNYYEESLTDLKRYTKSDEVTGGILTLMYKNAEVWPDGGSLGGGIPDAHAYFVNSKYLELTVHKEANFTRMDTKVSTNQDAEAVPFVWQGNLVTNGRKFLGVHKA